MRIFSFIPTLLFLGVSVFQQVAYAGSAGVDEILATTEGVPPNVLFVVDQSSSMSDPCNSSLSESCLKTVAKVIDAMSKHYDWARYGVVGTASADSTNTFNKIAPLGSSAAKISSALSSISIHGSSVSTRNIAEVISRVLGEYFRMASPEDYTDDDSDGFLPDWNEAPIHYSCQKNHIIVFTNKRPSGDTSLFSAEFYPDLSTIHSNSPSMVDIACNSSGASSTDTECLLDQTAWYAYNQYDARSNLTGKQNVTIHIIGIETDDDTLTDKLYQNVSDMQGGSGTYNSTNGSFDNMLAKVMTVMTNIRSGYYSRSAPIVSADGNYLIYSFYEIDSSSPLAQGHVRAYEIDNDPTSSTYGQVQYDGSSSFGGALWDGGTLLVSRLVTASENNEEDRDGIGRRDIYTFFEAGASLLSTETSSHKRHGFDKGFVSAIGSNSTALAKILDTTADPSNSSCAKDRTYDLDEDCDVDDDDLQTLVDFARGLTTAEFPALNKERGKWKLGDAPHATPAVVMNDNDIYTLDATYRQFLNEIEQNKYPPIVLSPANDGMLHAFRLDEDSSTNATEIGEELWAWIPGYLLYRSHDAKWAGRLIDQMIYGRTFLFDGSPVVQDVWIDEDGNGSKSCTAVPNDCEWHRVVVVQQGMGGPLTLALDITDTTAPKFLWEHVDESDSKAIGYTTGRPAIGNIYDVSDSSDPVDRYVAFWGSGRAVPISLDAAYYKATEGNLYMWAIGDDYYDTTTANYQGGATYDSPSGDNHHPEKSVHGSSLNIDGTDSDYEMAYISAALAVVDVDSDGDVDTLYFPMTTTYKPTSEGGSLSTISDPGSTWMYKACIDTTDPGEFTWAEFFDPKDDSNLTFRPPVYYAATTAWHSDGQLGVYWGTGTPFDRDMNRRGFFFAMKDSNPGSCSSFTVSAISGCGTKGVYNLGIDEGLTADPIVYAGVVYFPTYQPKTDRCDGGTGRMYGLRFDDCSSGIDTSGDGIANSSDAAFTSTSGYVSSVAVTDAGTIVYGSSTVTTDGSTGAVGTISSATNPFLGTTTIAWMEVF